MISFKFKHRNEYFAKHNINEMEAKIIYGHEQWIQKTVIKNYGRIL